MGQEMCILIHKFIVKFTASHLVCRNPVLASISFLSGTSIMCSTHQLSFFAHLHMEEERGALWIYTAEVQQFTFSHQLEIQMFSFLWPWGDQPCTAPYRAVSTTNITASALGKETTETSLRACHSFSTSLLTVRCSQLIILWWMNKLSPMSQLQNNFKWHAQDIVLWTIPQLTPEG